MTEQLELLHSILNRIYPIPTEIWQEAQPLFSHHTFKKDDHIIEMQDKVDDLHFIITGLARYYYLTEEGKEFNKSFQTTGQVLTSISSLVAGNPSPFFIQALIDMQTFSISYHDLKSLGEKFLHWNRFTILLLENVLIRKETREADFLLLNATKRYKKFLSEYATIAKQLPNYHIASYLGITEVQLSRIRSHLKLT